MADFYASKSGESFWPDAKPAPEPVVTPEPEPAPEPMMPEPMYMDPMMDPMYYPPEPVVQQPPVPQQPIQNPPTIQPLVIVPYVSQMQPLYQYTPEAMRAIYANGGPDVNQFKCGTGFPPQAYPTASENAMTTYAAPYGNTSAYGNVGYGNDYYNDYSVVDSTPAYDEPIAAPKEKKGPRANVAAIIGLVFGLVAVAFMVIGYFGFLPESIMPYLCVYKDVTVLNAIMTDLIEAIQNIPPFEIMAILVPAALALSALFTVITLLTNLFSVAARRYPIVGKVFAWLGFVFAAVAVVVLFITAKDDVKIGAYILAGITLLIAIICTTGRRK